MVVGCCGWLLVAVIVAGAEIADLALGRRVYIAGLSPPLFSTHTHAFVVVSALRVLTVHRRCIAGVAQGVCSLID
jgi:hypothetical protein